MDTQRLEAATFVTGNTGKLIEARRLSGAPLRSEAIDLPEIQSLSIAEVLQHKAEDAFRRLNRAVVVEETGFELDGMNGFPGALVKWMLEALGPEGFAQAAIATGNPRGRARCRLMLLDEHGPLSAEGVTEGVLCLPPRGTNGFGWDPVFVPDGSERTYAELADQEKDAVSHRGRAWRQLRRLTGESA